MPSTLRIRLNDLAASFSAGVLDAVRGASLEELLSESSGGKSRARLPAPGAVPPSVAPSRRRRSGRLPRRSAGDISQAVERIVGLLGDNPGGLRAEQIRQKLGLQAKELPRPLKEGLDGGRLSKVGRKRATTYFAGSAPSKGQRTAVTVASRAGRPRKASAGPKGAPAKAASKTRARKAGKRAAASKRRRSRVPNKKK